MLLEEFINDCKSDITFVRNNLEPADIAQALFFAMTAALAFCGLWLFFG